MTTPIGPGDYVECVKAPPGPNAEPALQPGRVFRVERAFQVPLGTCTCHGTQRDAGVLLLAELPTRSAAQGWCARLFRPVYRPKKSLIDELQTPVDAPIRETEDA